MIREISWYLKENRFAEVAREIESAVGDYASARKSGATGEELQALRERARGLCERHIGESGYREGQSTFVNVDAEFMTGDSVDEKALDSFIKEIIKAHCYQKVLWTYMGTTESFTQITKMEMRNQGLSYDKYLPESYKKTAPQKKPLGKKIDVNAVPIYAYSDGSASQTYDPDRARVRFDALGDASGIDWKKGYDPNASVSKDGWHGAFDDTGTWVKVERRKDSAEPAKNGTGIPDSVKIVRTGDSATIIDNDRALLESRELRYVTEGGELYGALDADPAATTAAVSEALAAMGIKKVAAVSAGAEGVTDRKVAEAYRKALGPLAAKTLAMIEPREAAALIDREREAAKAREAEGRGIAAERTIDAVRATGNRGDALGRAIAAGYATVPLRPSSPQDAQSLSLSEEERVHVASLKVPADREGAFNAALANLYAAWPLYAAGGLSKLEMADEAHRLLVRGKQSDATLPTETTLAAIATGERANDQDRAGPTHLATTGIPGSFSDERVNLDDPAERDAFLSRLERARKLPKGGKEAALAAIEALPPSDSETQRAKDRRAIARVLSQYPAISTSTGSTIAETVNAAVKAAGGKTKQQPTPTGTHTPSAKSDPATRRVFYDLSIDDLITAASKENLQTRAVPVDGLVALSTIGAPEATVVIGGASGKSARDLGFDRNTLSKQYRMTDTEAGKTETFLHDIRLPVGATRATETALAALIAETLTPATKKAPAPAAKDVKKALLEKLDERSDVTYNLASDTGLDAYAQGKRFKTAGIKKETLSDIVETRTSQPGNREQQRDAGIRAITPVYVSRPGIILANRTTAKGIPEKVHAETRTTPVITQAESMSEQASSVTMRKTRAANESAVMHGIGSGDNTLPTLIIGSNPQAESRDKTLLSVAGLTETKLVSTYGYAPAEARRTKNFLEDITVPEGKADIAKTEIVPALRKSIKNAKSAKTMKTNFIETLSPRSDVAYALSNPKGLSAYTLTKQFADSGMTPEKLERSIQKALKENGASESAANDSVYAQRTVTIGGNGLAERSAALIPETVFLKNAGTSLSRDLVHGRADTPALIVGGETPDTAGRNRSGSSPTTLAAVAGLSAPKLVEKYGYTAVEAEKAAEVLRNITVSEGMTGHVTSEILPELKKALDAAKTSKGLKGELATRLGTRPDVAYNLATNQAAPRTKRHRASQVQASGRTSSCATPPRSPSDRPSRREAPEAPRACQY